MPKAKSRSRPRPSAASPSAGAERAAAAFSSAPRDGDDGAAAGEKPSRGPATKVWRTIAGAMPLGLGVVIGLAAVGLAPCDRDEAASSAGAAASMSGQRNAAVDAGRKPKAATREPGVPADEMPQAAWRPLERGPWGTLEAAEITLEPPEEHITPEACVTDAPLWHFPDFGPELFAGLLDEARLSPEQRASLLRAVRCAPPGGPNGGCVVQADLELLAGLDLHARGVIYRVLARHPENPLYFYAPRRRPSEVASWLSASGLPEEAIAEIRSRLFPIGEYSVFADRPLLCASLTTAQHRRTLQRMLARTPSLLVQLRIGPNDDVRAIADYWSAGGRRNEVLPLLESIARAPGGGVLDIAHLLPSFARARLFTFPAPDDPPRRDCHWTSMNFWSRVPDDRFVDPEAVRRALESDFVPIDPKEVRLGDVIVFEGRAGRILHSAVFIAADVVFTKNGASQKRPWLLMRLRDVIGGYHADGGVALQYARRRKEP